jgi:glucose/arabinose dehydrogenase
VKRYVAIVALLVLSGAGGVGCQSSKAALPEGSGFRVLTAGLADPWEITWGPGGFLWVTEKTGKKVTRENPLDGSKSAVMTITEVYHAGGQDDLLGMAFQSGPSKGGQNYVYFAYTYDAAAGAAIDRRAKIARYTYDPAAGTLNDPIDVITGRPAGDDHNGGSPALRS